MLAVFLAWCEAGLPKDALLKAAATFSVFLEETTELPRPPLSSGSLNTHSCKHPDKDNQKTLISIAKVDISSLNGLSRRVATEAHHSQLPLSSRDPPPLTIWILPRPD